MIHPPENPRGHTPEPNAALDLMRLAAWFGLGAGLLEVLTKVACVSIGRFGHLYQMSRHFVWLIPLTNLFVFAIVSLPLAALALAAPAPGRWLGLRSFLALALLPPLLLALPEIHPAAWCVFAIGLAARLAPSLEKRAVRFRQAVKATLPAMAVIVAVLASWMIGGEWLGQSIEAARPVPAAGAPNVLFIVLDTVRADRLSLNGYKRATTPALEMLAKRGVRFANARSTSPWTLPGHASMFTSRLPHELKARWLAPLGAKYPTLASYLSARGYATAGFAANALYCGYDTGLADGFARYVDYDLPQMDAFLMAQLTNRGVSAMFEICNWLRAKHPSPFADRVESFLSQHVFSGGRKDAAAINRDFLAWLANRQQPARPFFAFLNYMDAHAPYFPSGPPGFAFGTTPATPADFELLQNWEQIDKLALDRRAQQLASDSYDSCLRALDEHIKSLLVQLDRHALLGQTLIIVTADHGEAFGEHDLFVHGDSVYRAETQVPLLIVPPARHATQAAVDEVVSLRDLPATIVDLLELKAPSPFQGASLARFWKSQTTNRLECAVSELAEPNPINPNFGRSPAKAGPLSAVTDGHYTLIVGPKSEELYDETTDPAQSQNLAADPAMSAIVDRLRFELRRALGQNPAQTSSISAPENDPGRAAGGRLRPTD